MNNIIRNKPYYKGVTKDLKSPTQANKLTYTPGTIVEADDLNLDPDKDCGAGINFCSTLAGALRWAKGGTVVTVTVPDGEPIVDTGDKLRAKRVLVGEVVSLSDANLRDANLSGANFRNANLRNANLRNANLRDANLSGADLTGAYLRDADLSGANFRNANLRNANLWGADLTDADLTDANLTGAYLRDADLSGANFRNANLTDAYLVGANLRDARGNDRTILPKHYKVVDGYVVRETE